MLNPGGCITRVSHDFTPIGSAREKSLENNLCKLVKYYNPPRIMMRNIHTHTHKKNKSNTTHTVIGRVVV